jgi:acyl-CoA thioesterase
MTPGGDAPTPFARATSVVPAPGRPGTYVADIGDVWDAPILPHGGVVSALALRAMADHLDEPDKRLRTATTVFAAQVPPGAAEVEVTVLRRGRAMSQLMATVRADGAVAGHTTVAVFGADRPGFSFTDAMVPSVPPPDACPSMRDALPEGIEDRWRWRRSPFWEHVEMRLALGHTPWDEWAPATLECASWLRFDEPPRSGDGALDPLAVVALCDTMPGAVGERLGPDQPQWRAPSADLTVHLLGDATSEWILAHKRAHHAGDGYASLELTMWDEAGVVVAFATQMMLFSFPEGPPPAP